jgi:hypothetical protein
MPVSNCFFRSLDDIGCWLDGGADTYPLRKPNERVVFPLSFFIIEAAEEPYLGSDYHISIQISTGSETG